MLGQARIKEHKMRQSTLLMFRHIVVSPPAVDGVGDSDLCPSCGEVYRVRKSMLADVLVPPRSVRIKVMVWTPAETLLVRQR